MRISLLAVGCVAIALSGIGQAQFTTSQGTSNKGPTPKNVKPVIQKSTQTSLSVRPIPLTAALVGGSDDCSTAQTANAISGVGQFSVDTTLATTGAPAASCGLLGTDVWFYWTATTSGVASIQTCGLVGNDSALALWDAAGVPAGTCPSVQLACNDDSCGLQSRVSYTVTAGQSYFIQVGSFNGGAGYIGAIDISVTVPTGNDDCSAAIALTGPGPFNYDNSGATTGFPTGSCGAIGSDLWYRWTAPSTGVATLSLCGTAANDTALAVWDGTGIATGACPTTQVACNDDSCGLQSQVTFSVTAGQNFFFEVGSYNGTSSGPGALSVNVSAPAVNDGCNAAIAVSGFGSFPFDNVAASTGTEGQNEAACLFFGSSAVASDVWYTWTAPSTGKVVFSLCTGAANDSKIAVYSGNGCPTTPAIACNDDKCALTSEVCFDAVGGQVYTLQIGLYPLGGAAGTAGAFEMRSAAGATGNDGCATPTTLVGNGPHAFDTSFATTGCEGQDNGACLFFGSTVIDNDTWYTWTAPTSDQYQVSLCGSATDTKLAVYQGAGCPTGAALACNDDACALQSQLCFPATAGQTYTIQIGAYPGAGGGPGTLSFIPVVAPTGCQHDDGSSENSLGLGAGGGIVWLQRYGSAGGSTTLNSVSAAFDTPLFPGTGLIGVPVTACVWDDPNDDGNPSDAVLVAQTAGVVINQSADIFDVYAFTTPVTVSGVFFVGISITAPAGNYPAALDQTGCPASSNGRAWIAGNTAGPADIVNLLANPVALADMDTIGFPGVWMLRADCNGAVGTAYCFGDGTATACPCGNVGAAGSGCANSVNVNGAKLEAQGNASMTADSLTLRGTGMSPTGTCLYFQGTTRLSGGLGVVFGDGLRCAGGTIVRLGTKTNSAGASAYGNATADIPVSVRGQLPAGGGTRTYQVWYRNAVAFCTPSVFNLTNGLEIVWTP